MPVLENKNGPSPANVVFVVEGTALCGAYLNELKQAYILPTLEYFSGGPVDEMDYDSSSPWNYALYGLVVFHASDILPGYLTDVCGPITTSHRLITALDRIQFAGGYGEAASYVGEGLATALQCLDDLAEFRKPRSETAKKHVILICNCKPYGLPVTESGGKDDIYRGMTAEQLAAQMQEKGVFLSIMSPRKIPALIGLFDKSGGESTSQKTYAREVRHLVLLNGYHLQERPVTPKQVPDVPAVMNPPPPASTPSSQAQVTTSANANQPTSHASGTHNPQQVPTSVPSQEQSPQSIVPPPPSPVQVPPQPVSSHAPMMPSPSSVVAPSPSSMQQTSMAMSIASQASMAQARNTMSPMMMTSQPPTSMGMNVHPTQQPQQRPNQLQQQQLQQQIIVIRNRTPMPTQNIRQMQAQNQSMNPNQMGQVQVSMSGPGGPQQPPPGQQIMNSQQMHPTQQQMNINQQLSQQLHNQHQQNMNLRMGQQFPNQQHLGQQMNPQRMTGQQHMNASNLGQRMSAQISQHQQQPQVSQSQQLQTSQNMGRWPNQMSTASSMQRMQQTQTSLVRMSNVNQPQINQQPILSTGIQPSALQQQLQQNHQNQQQQQLQQTAAHSTLLAQLKIPPIGSQQAPPGVLVTGPPTLTKERLAIWCGMLEWSEKQKGRVNGQKVPCKVQVPCKVSTNVVNGESEVKGEGWPQKLSMQLIPKQMVGSLGGSFLARDVKTVAFMLQNCEALSTLTRVMESGYVGCVQFHGAVAPCNIKVLILMYSKERRTYLGFIPTDQIGFVDRLRTLIKKKQPANHQGQGFPGPGGGMPNAGLMPGQQPGPGMIQGQQQGLAQAHVGMLYGHQQTGIMQQPQPGMVQAQQTPISSLVQQLGQTAQVPPGQSPLTALAQQLGQAQQLQQQIQQQQQQIQNPRMGGGNMDSLQAQSEFGQLEIERQQNLLAIQQLQQTLQAAQQRELQFQQLQHHPVLGQGSHQQQQQQQHPVSGPRGHQQHQQSGPGQMQVQIGQQQIMQGGLGQQQQQIPRQMMNPQSIGQMRMMRSSVSQSNPGLKLLLQQQPGTQGQGYRMQQMPVQQQQQRMQGQMGMPGQMQGQQGGQMQTNQQISQYEDVGILDLLR